MRVCLLLLTFPLVCWAAGTVTVNTTSGQLQGIDDGTVMWFKGVRYGQKPTRWGTPVEFTSSDAQNATAFGATCIQMFHASGAELDQSIYNNPSNPPTEDEDCLFLNVWAPSPKGQSLPVGLWIYGGSRSRSAPPAVPMYDGIGFAQNQGIVFVTFSYRTNVFGFPGSQDLPLEANNLGYMDQELVMKWVQENIAQFGGDPAKVTLLGESAGALSVSTAVARHTPGTAPFRAAIMFSGAQTSLSATPNYDPFNNFAKILGCGGTPGDERLACLRKLPAAVIRKYTNSPGVSSFRPIVDNKTVFADPLGQIRAGKTANVPFMIGTMQDDGSLFSIGINSLPAYLLGTTNGRASAAPVRKAYPQLNDSQIIPQVIKDFTFNCPAQLWTAAAYGVGVIDLYRYTYGAVFQDLQVFPNAGAWHSSEVPEVFGTYNRSTASADEITLSATMQTTIANFIKDPTTSPAPNWAKYTPGTGNTLARLAYDGNVQMSNLVEMAASDSLDSACTSLWDSFLDQNGGDSSTNTTSSNPDGDTGGAVMSGGSIASTSTRVIRVQWRPYTTQGPNHAILDMLKSNQDEEAQRPTKNPYKIRAFKRAIEVVSALDHPLRSAEDAKALQSIGPGILRRIEDYFVAKGPSPEVDAEAVDAAKRDRLAREELEQIPGIGAVKARALVAAGCRSIEQLQTTPELLRTLTKQQQIGVRYFRQLARVSREEAESVAQFIRESISPKFEVVLGGSYRRGLATSSDIDLIVLHPEHVHVPFPAQTSAKAPRRPRATRKNAASEAPRTLLQAELVPALTDRGLLAAALSSGDLKWQGIRRSRRGEGTYRRLDLNLVAQKSRGAGLIAFTGDTDFNRELRMRAHKMGLHLNEFGLWRWNDNGLVASDAESSGSDSESGSDSDTPRAPAHKGFWELLRTETEEGILSELGIKYLEPSERDYSSVTAQPKVEKRGRKKRAQDVQ
ncbi:Carboxylic ester hydrolase [Mycena kentingensis (nom. inval.)]|nr:Carboxylic ester hydrolase [Mycena kentingensis (nom. inval.)]